eukprot:TRINITY_DN1853_c0_g1_i5.p1 TRINITY_DN1853_c0_g1~~TRINITY_DN1853_c0_g1_i5.p1  ORF type:complete len:463 (+),score=41.81 TRINITY_DN1853_c0_g1_i5:123-1391(+)
MNVMGEGPIVYVPTADSLIMRDQEMSLRREQAQDHHYKDVWQRDPHSTQYQKVIHTKKDEDENAGEIQPQLTSPFGPTSNLVGNHMTEAAKNLIHEELKGVDFVQPIPQENLPKNLPRHRASLDLIPHRIYSSPAPLDPILKDPGFEYYTWTDDGDSIIIKINTITLGCSDAHAKVEFGYSTVGIEVFNGKQLRYKLKIPKLFAPVQWEECKWSMKKSILIIELVKFDATIQWHKLHGRMIFERVIPLHTVSESLVQLQKIKQLAEPFMTRTESTSYILSLINDDQNELKLSLSNSSQLQKEYSNIHELMSVGNYEEAQKSLEMFVGQVSKDDNILGQAIINLAKCLKQNGHIKRAVECLSWLIQKYAGSEIGAQALLQRAILYEELERMNLAHLDAKMVLMFDKENEVAQALLRRLQSKLV